jgi:hypothetical protein
VQCATSIARECANGFVLTGTAPGSRVEANIAGGNRGSGYLADRADGVLITANNASYNDLDGFRLTDTTGADLVANMAANNNQSATEGCAIRPAGATRDSRVYYNNCQDEQMQPTQTRAILEDPSAGGDLLRFNLTRKPAQILAQGQGSTASDNAIE